MKVKVFAPQLCLTLCDPKDCSMPGFPVLHYLLEFAQTRVHCVSYAIQPSHPLSSPFPPSFNLSQHQGLFSESVLPIKWPKYWSFRFSISPSSDYSGLIFFRIDWFDLLAAHGTFKSLIQHHNSKASILQRSAFFMIQLSHLSLLLENHSLVGKMMSLLFNMLSRFIITFLLRNKHLLILWLQSPSAVILEPKKIKSVTVYAFSLLFALK